jgi:hypothetical protein
MVGLIVRITRIRQYFFLQFPLDHVYTEKTSYLPMMYRISLQMQLTPPTFPSLMYKSHDAFYCFPINQF